MASLFYSRAKEIFAFVKANYHFSLNTNNIRTGRNKGEVGHEKKLAVFAALSIVPENWEFPIMKAVNFYYIRGEFEKFKSIDRWIDSCAVLVTSVIITIACFVLFDQLE